MRTFEGEVVLLTGGASGVGHYPTPWHAYEAAISGCSTDERVRLFCANAERSYRI